jgi:hypothetical protein
MQSKTLRVSSGRLKARNTTGSSKEFGDLWSSPTTHDWISINICSARCFQAQAPYRPRLAIAFQEYLCKWPGATDSKRRAGDSGRWAMDRETCLSEIVFAYDNEIRRAAI